MTIQLSKRALRAALLFAAQGDIRYYLNGVKLEATKTHTTLIATDGHRIIAVRSKAENKRKAEMIIPRDVCREASKGRVTGDVSLEIKGKNTLIQTQLGMLQFDPIEGNFPDWRKVMHGYKMPETRENKPLGIRGKYLGDCEAATKHLGSLWAGISIAPSDDMQKIVRIIPDGVTDFEVEMFVIPMRTSDSATEQPLPKWIPK